MRKGHITLCLLLPACSLVSRSNELVEMRSEQGAKYPVDRYLADHIGAKVIHAIGIYEGGSRHDFDHSPRETVTVELDDPGPRKLFLALSSYEPVDWELIGPSVAAVHGVYLDGYNKQHVSGVRLALVTNRSLATLRDADASAEDVSEADQWSGARRSASSQPIACAYTYAKPSGGGCDAALQFTANAEALFEAKLTTFTGIYNAQYFRIHALPAN